MQSEHLGEHEGAATVGVEVCQHIIEFDTSGWISRDEGIDRSNGGIVHHRVVETPPATGATGVVHAGSTGDREQPASCRTIGTEAVDRTNGPLIGLLREIVGELHVTEIPTDAPDVGLCFGHEPLEHDAITVARCDEQVREMVHTDSVAPPDRDRSVTNVSCFLSDRGTETVPSTTLIDMDADDCEITCEVLSARADGEASGDEIEFAEAHLSRCGPCSSFAARDGPRRSPGPRALGRVDPEPRRRGDLSFTPSPARTAADGCARRWPGWPW